MITITNNAYINSDTLVELLTAIKRLHPDTAISLVMDNARYQRCDKVIANPINEDAGLEVGVIGNEGMLGITLMLGVNVAPFHALVHGAGPALRMTASSFLDGLEQSPALQLELKRYLYVSMSQLAQMSTCIRFHVVEARLARRLLMTQDRAHSDHFHVTQVSLAYMLGVRRVGITKAANSLLKKKLISYLRGDITILDGVGLEAASCDCYRADKETYERHLG